MGKTLRYWVALVLVPVQAAMAAPCAPECRTGFVCVQDRCVSRCNPACGSGEQCTDRGECVTTGAGLSPPPPPPPLSGTDLPPPPPPPPLEAGSSSSVSNLPYTPEPSSPRLLELKSELHEARNSPSLGSGITLLALGTSFLIAAVALWGLGLGWFGGSSRFGPCGESGTILYCLGGFATTIPGLIMTPIGLVRLIRAITGRARIPALEEEILQLGGRIPEE